MIINRKVNEEHETQQNPQREQQNIDPSKYIATNLLV